MRLPAASTVAKYLRTLAAELGLAGWRLDVEHCESSPEHWATVAVERAQQVATVSVTPDLFGQPAADQRHFLTHELVHVILAPLDWSFDEVAAGLSKRARGIAQAVWDQRSERACDDLTRLVAGRLPLPPWCK